MIKQIIKRLTKRYMLYRSIAHLSIWRTIFVNFYFLPLSQARKLPIYVYGKLRFTQISGNIIIDSNEVKRGMISINATSAAPAPHDANSIINLGLGKIVFKGNCNILRDSKILIWGGGLLTLGADVYISHKVNIACCNSITIGDKCRVGHEVQIFDTNFHFTYGDDLKVHRNNKPVVLGHHTWVGARSSIMKGVELPPYTSIASNSLVNKTIAAQERTLIGGSPAKIIKTPFSRMFSFATENKIATYFATHPDKNEYQLSEPLEQYD